jgi:hypothetical protein
MLPGLPERNPGLELANAFSVTNQKLPHSPLSRASSFPALLIELAGGFFEKLDFSWSARCCFR